MPNIPIYVELPEPEEPSFWESVLRYLGVALRWFKRYIFAPLPLFLIVVFGLVLYLITGDKSKVGGLIGRLLGNKPGARVIDVVNVVPKDRVDPNGNIISPGEPDSKGLTQAVVVPIEPSSIFSNPDSVKIVPPGESKPIEISLPDGVKASDVDAVIIVKPGILVVSVRDSSKVSTRDIDYLLTKYGS